MPERAIVRTCHREIMKRSQMELLHLSPSVKELLEELAPE